MSCDVTSASPSDRQECLSCLFYLLVIFFGLALPAVAEHPENAKPNIVFIMADDQGYGDAGCYNEKCGFPTPGIDRLAKEGMRFTDAHSASAVCTPTRYGLLTGRYAWRTRLQSGVLTGDQDPLIAEDTTTVGSLLGKQGYHTACIGKWHLGFRYEMPQGEKIKNSKALGNVDAVPVGSRLIGGPTTRGFATFMGFHHAREMATWIVDDQVTENIHVQQMLPRITRSAVEYLQARAEAGGPFFLYLPLSAPHTPIVPDEPWIGRSQLGAYGDFVMQVDATVAQVLKALDDTKLAANTIVVFTADNGCSPAAKINELRDKGHDPMAGLRGHKADVWEGGHRVPYVVRWPGVVKPGTVSDEPICLNSLMATCAEILSVTLGEDEGVDSFSILPVLRGEQRQEPTHPVIIHHSFSGKFAIRQGDWKYLHCQGSGGWSKGGDGKPAQLYNLRDDRGEQNNLIDTHGTQAAALRELMIGAIERGRTTEGPMQDNDVPVKAGGRE